MQWCWWALCWNGRSQVQARCPAVVIEFQTNGLNDPITILSRSALQDIEPVWGNVSLDKARHYIYIALLNSIVVGEPTFNCQNLLTWKIVYKLSQGIPVQWLRAWTLTWLSWICGLGQVSWPSFLFCKRGKMIGYSPGKVAVKIKWVNNIFG